MNECEYFSAKMSPRLLSVNTHSFHLLPTLDDYDGFFSFQFLGETDERKILSNVQFLVMVFKMRSTLYCSLW